jgi:hypothetical protein
MSARGWFPEPARRVGVLTRMTATFLHADKPVSPDEEIDVRAPDCEACGATMWLTNRTRRSTDDGTREIRSYACKNCGAAKDVVERV